MKTKVLMIYLIATIRAYISWRCILHCQPSLWKPSVAVVIVVVVGGGGGVRDFFAHADFSLWSVPSRLSPIMAESCPFFRASPNKFFPTFLPLRLTIKLEMMMQIGPLVN